MAENPKPGLHRELTKGQAVAAFLILGWLGAFVIMFVGDDEVSHRWPSLASCHLE